MRVLGIDPGLRLTGYGCVDDASASSRRTLGRSDAALIEAGVLRLPVTKPVADRLVVLEQDIRELLERLSPAVVAVEKLYAHYKHPATAIIMGHARGVILLAARRAGRQIVELQPTEIKKSLTGKGHAGKGQIQRTVQAEFNLAQPPSPPDVADAIAVALCALRRAEV